MPTTYALLADRCGLSHREAAALHGVRLDTVKSWSAGRNRVPEGVVSELRKLYAAIERAAGEAVQIIESKAPRNAPIELGYCADDHEAQSLGWPCVGTHAALLGLIAARVAHQIIMLPRGSTPATAKAADAHGR
jgi:hypothetical protein